MNLRDLDRRTMFSLGALAVVCVVAAIWFLMSGSNEPRPSPAVKQQSDALRSDMAKSAASAPATPKPPEPDLPPSRTPQRPK